MPSFTNNTKIANKAIEKACEQLLLASLLEATYQDAKWGDNWYDCRESMLNDLMNDEVEKVLSDTEVADAMDDYNYVGSHHHY